MVPFSGRLTWALILVVLASAPARAQLSPEDAPQVAGEIVYRLELELGPVDAAQRHLLAWHLLAAVEEPALTGELSLADAFLLWQQRLEGLETSMTPGPLPGWQGISPPDTVSAMLGALQPSDDAPGWQSVDPEVLRAKAILRQVLAAPEDAVSVVLYRALLGWTHRHGLLIWREVLDELATDPELMLLIEPLLRPWLALPLDRPLSEWRQLEDRAAERLRALRARSGTALDRLRSSIDALQFHGVRADLTSANHLDAWFSLGRRQADPLDYAIVSLSEAVLRIEEGAFADLVRNLFGLAHEAVVGAAVADGRERVEAVLDQLARMDDWLPVQFTSVDGRMLTAYQQIRRILRDWVVGGSGALSRNWLDEMAPYMSVTELIDADLPGYLDLPFRRRFESRALFCLSVGNAPDAFPPLPMGREEFDACAEDLAQWAIDTAATVELSGLPEGPFEPEHRSRELAQGPLQRINYWLGYVDVRLLEDCELETESVLVNPLEWALAARAYREFVARWPAYAADGGQRERIRELVDAGRRILALERALATCREAAEVEPLLTQLGRYGASLDRVLEALASATGQFRERFLKEGADVELGGDSLQATRYRPENRLVGPCPEASTCGMSEELVPSRALYELFPEPLLVAEQVGLGDVRMCYRAVEWVERRAEVPAVRNQAMANYFGHLRFELVGYVESPEEPYFRLRLTGRQEYEYLFGANEEELLDDACPKDRVNTQVKSQLPERRIELVPRRLTFMTAERMAPPKVFAEHWSDGEEWRDRFVTGQGIEVLERRGADERLSQIDERLAELYGRWNRAVYEDMLADDPLHSGDAIESGLRAAMVALEIEKRTFAAIARILFPSAVVSLPAPRASLYGEPALFDRRGALQLQRSGVPVDMVEVVAEGQLQDAQLYWREVVPEEPNRRPAADPLVVTTLAELVELLDAG